MSHMNNINFPEYKFAICFCTPQKKIVKAMHTANMHNILLKTLLRDV